MMAGGMRINLAVGECLEDCEICITNLNLTSTRALFLSRGRIRGRVRSLCLALKQLRYQG